MTGFDPIAASIAVINVSAATGDGSFAAQLTRVAIDRCDTDESSDTAAVELAEPQADPPQSVRGDMANTQN